MTARPAGSLDQHGSHRDSGSCPGAATWPRRVASGRKAAAASHSVNFVNFSFRMRNEIRPRVKAKAFAAIAPTMDVHPLVRHEPDPDHPG